VERDGGAGCGLRLAGDLPDASVDRRQLPAVERKVEVVEQRILGRQRESNPERSCVRVRVAELVVGVERDRIGGIPEQSSLTLLEVEVHPCPGALQRERDLAHQGAGHRFADRRATVARGLHDVGLGSRAQHPGDRPCLVVRAAPEGFDLLLEPRSNPPARASSEEPSAAHASEAPRKMTTMATRRRTVTMSSPAGAIRSAEPGGCPDGPAESSAGHERPMSIG
jgi:hypothetical protein